MIFNSLALQLSTFLALSLDFSFLFSLVGPRAAVVLFQSTLLLAIGLLAAFLVGPKRLAQQSLIYRSLLLGIVCITVAVATPISSIPFVINPPGKMPFSSSIEQFATDDAPQSDTASNFKPEENTTMQSKLSNSISSDGKQTNYESSFSASSEWLSVAKVNAISILFHLWLIVAAAKLMWLFLASFYAAHLRRAPAITDSGVLLLLQQLGSDFKVSTPSLAAHPKVQIPFLSGLIRPVIVLPSRYTSEFDEPSLKAILSHELAHLSGRDCWWKYLSGIVGALLWFHPLMWLLQQRMEQVEEALCDEAVLRGGCSPHTYANVLLNVSENLAKRPLEQVVGAGIIPFRSQLGQRIQRIMGFSHRNIAPFSYPARCITVVVMAVFIVTIATLFSVDAAPRNAAQSEVAPRRSRIVPGVGPTAWGVRFNPPIPQNNTPETRIGLPATLEAAQGNATITGRVIYENGQPVVGVRVTVSCGLASQTELWGYKRNQSDHYRWSDKISHLISNTAVTGADGTYRVKGLIAGQRFGARLRGDRLGNRAPQGWLVPERVKGIKTVANQSRQAPDIVLRKSAQIRIKAIDQDTGVSLEGILWSGFLIDESGQEPGNRHIDAHGKMRPFKSDDSMAVTDKSGICTLSLDTGKVYFYMDGGTAIRSLGNEQRHSFPNGIITQNGIYKREDWCMVMAPNRITQRKWKGETELELNKGQVPFFTIKLKRYRALNTEDKRLLKWSQEPHHRPSY